MKEICNECNLFTCATLDTGEKIIYDQGDVFERRFEIDNCEFKKKLPVSLPKRKRRKGWK